MAIRPGILMFALLLAWLPGSVTAQSRTTYKTGEMVSGNTRQCYYGAGRSQSTLSVLAQQQCPASVQLPQSSLPKIELPKPGRAGRAALKSGEATTGMAKQCFYAFEGASYSRTVKSYESCPPSIEVPKKPDTTRVRRDSAALPLPGEMLRQPGVPLDRTPR